MSFYRNRPSLSQRFRLVQASFLQKEGLPFAEVLPEEQIEEVFREAGGCFAREEGDFYTPALTLWAWLSQVLAKGPQRSCLMAVSRVLVLLVLWGQPPCCKNTGAYCRARAKLPEVVLERLTVELAQGCEDAVPQRWLWRGRHILLADGSTVSMPDTAKNQAEYPQQKGQQEGVGFPIARIVVLLSLATAMLHGMAMAPYSGKETGETALLREMLQDIDPRTILLTDRSYGNYFMIALVLLGRRDFVARPHQCRRTDFRHAQRLGKGDWLVQWTRPQRPDWMDLQSYAQMPKSIDVRLVEVQVQEPGFRTESFLVVTTLTDVKTYPKQEIAALYRQRWQVELDIRAIKATMGMDVLSCKTPEMVRREMWVCLLAYNLIRKTMLQAAKAYDVSPRELSFTTALQTIAASLETMVCLDNSRSALLITAQLASLTDQIVGHRPNRVEPRAVKRRPKPYDLLLKPREQARAELLENGAR